MPELPEVETIRNDLGKKILKKKIVRVEIKLDRAVKNRSSDFTVVLTGNSFSRIERIGKLMIFALSKKEKYLLVHLKMTGQLIYCLKNHITVGGHSLPAGREALPKLAGNLPSKHTRVILYFQDRSALFFNDMRTFGYLRLVDKDELDKVKAKFGLDPLGPGMNEKNLSLILKNKKASIKALLLNQELIAGIGNIYADEILFAAGLRPDRKGGTIKPAEIKKIIRATKTILHQAIKYRGTTFNDYADSEGRQGNFVKMLKVYGRKGKQCYKCRGRVAKIKVAGRGTHFCPQCQS